MQEHQTCALIRCDNCDTQMNIKYNGISVINEGGSPAWLCDECYLKLRTEVKLRYPHDSNEKE